MQFDSVEVFNGRDKGEEAVNGSLLYCLGELKGLQMMLDLIINDYKHIRQTAGK